jgi:DNA-binding CsgD family transcriptional regulator
LDIELNVGEDGATELHITDDGRGFQPSAGSAGGLGLTGMAERARLVGGELDVRPTYGWWQRPATGSRPSSRRSPSGRTSVLDVSMPRMTGLQAAREIHAQDEGIGLLMLSMHDNDRYFLKALSAGASATCSNGPPETRRELEVLELIAEAHSNRQIADTLMLSEKTVESQRANLLSKLGMRDRVELVRYAIRRGLIEP